MQSGAKGDRPWPVGGGCRGKAGAMTAEDSELVRKALLSHLGLVVLKRGSTLKYCYVFCHGRSLWRVKNDPGCHREPPTETPEGRLDSKLNSPEGQTSMSFVFDRNTISYGEDALPPSLPHPPQGLQLQSRSLHTPPWTMTLPKASYPDRASLLAVNSEIKPQDGYSNFSCNSPSPRSLKRLSIWFWKITRSC